MASKMDSTQQYKKHIVPDLGGIKRPSPPHTFNEGVWLLFGNAEGFCGQFL